MKRLLFSLLLCSHFALAQIYSNNHHLSKKTSPANGLTKITPCPTALSAKGRLDIVNNPFPTLLYPTARNSKFVKKRGLWQMQMKQKRKLYSLL